MRIFKNFVYDNTVDVYKEALETASKAGITLSSMSILVPEHYMVPEEAVAVRLEFYSEPELKLFERAFRSQLGIDETVALFVSNFDEHFILDGADVEYGITEAIYCDGSNGTPEGHIVHFTDNEALVEFVTTMASGY